MKAVTAGVVSALLVGVSCLVPGTGRLPAPPRLPAAAAFESVDESPFGIAEHRRPRRAVEPVLAPAAAPASPSLEATIERLEASGDVRDGYRAFRLIAKCVHARRRDDAMRSLPMGPAHAAERRAYGDGRRRVGAACRDIAPAQIAARLPLVENAARAGVPGAVTAWIEEGPFGDPSALEQRPDDPLVAAWVGQAIERVKAAAARGDVEAIIQLGLLSLNWELDPIDRLRLLVQQAAGRSEPLAMSRSAPERADPSEAPATPPADGAIVRE